MSTFTQDEVSAKYQVNAYQPGWIKINASIITHSVIITPETMLPWTPRNINELTIESFKPIINLKPTILLIGTGSKLIFPNIESYGELMNRAIGIEIMNTGAACRTFSALAAEKRNVAAALLLI